MLRSVRQLYGKPLGASNGEIGQVKDFYFNDQQWVVRYVIADTGAWLSGRLVLISPHAFKNIYQKAGSLLVSLTRQQIENSPPIDSHKPVSRQYEEDYYRYYGWPSYWGGDGIWGVGGLPEGPWPYLMPSTQASQTAQQENGDDPHLRSTLALNGYQVEASDGAVGRLTDFVIDDENWAIYHLVVETGHWFAGKEIIVAPNKIDRISYEESTVFVKETKEAILEAPEYHVSPLGVT